jgi:hypothetical protein
VYDNQGPQQATENGRKEKGHRGRKREHSKKTKKTTQKLKERKEEILEMTLDRRRWSTRKKGEHGRTGRAWER